MIAIPSLTESTFVPATLILLSRLALVLSFFVRCRASDEALVTILDALAEFDLAFRLTLQEELLYGMRGYMFPSLRPTGELFLLPQTSVARNQSQYWKGQSVRVSCGFCVRGSPPSRPPQLWITTVRRNRPFFH